MNIVMSNPGFSQIAQNIIWRLDHKSQLNCRMVDQTWKAQVDQPYFWIKKLDSEKGQLKDLREAWIDLAGRIEKGSFLEQELRKCLMKFYSTYSSIPESTLIGSTPLHIAAGIGSAILFEFIASYTDDCNPTKSYGWTPLHLAARFGHIEIVKLIAAKIENPNLAMPDGWTPIHQAARYGHTEIFKFLATKIDDPNLAMLGGWTPMHLAASDGHIEIVKFLTTKIENPNPPKPDGWTPIH